MWKESSKSVQVWVLGAGFKGKGIRKPAQNARAMVVWLLNVDKNMTNVWVPDVEVTDEDHWTGRSVTSYETFPTTAR